MSFIARHITDEGERLIYLTRLHWIYLIDGLCWLLGFWLIGFGMEWALVNYAGSAAGQHQYILGYDLGPGVVLFKRVMIAGGFFLFLMHLFAYLSTEVALTSRRIIFKRGIISTEVEEIDLGEIRGEKIHHGILGSTLDYGKIKLDSRFVGDIFLPAIRKPYKFLHIMQKTRNQIAPNL